MAKSIFFTALKDYGNPKTREPAVIAGVRCRFWKGKHYEIPVRGQPQLVAAIEAEIKAGNMKRLKTGEGVEAVEQQGERDRKRRAERSQSLKNAVRMGLIPPGKLSVTVDNPNSAPAKE